MFLGLSVVATVCGRSTTNRRAIEELVAEARMWSLREGEEPERRRIVIDGITIIPLYDVPHLIKGIRNNLLRKNLIWTRGHHQEVLTAKWSDIVKAYHIDSCAEDNLRCLPRIKEMHVLESRMNKMKVSCATQVLSHSMAATISIMARNG